MSQDEGTGSRETGIEDIQGKIKKACNNLQKLGFDSLVVITSKTKPVELHDGSDKGRQFIEDFPDYFEDFIYYCKVKKEKQTSSSAETDQFLENKPKANIATISVKPPKSEEDSLTPEEANSQTEESQESNKSTENDHEAEITVEIDDNLDGDFDVDFADGDESGLEEEMEIDTNKTGKKMIINKLGKGKNAKLKEEKPKKRKIKPLDPSAPKETFDCEPCGKKYSSKRALIIHNRKHTGETPYVCLTCGKAFRSSSFLRSHETVHSDELKYECDQCDRAFAWKDSLRRHKIGTHSDERRHTCDLCGATFKDNSAFSKHKIRHTGYKKHACGVCGKLFMFAYQVTEHSHVHTGEKRFPCKICGQKFSSRVGAKKHAQKHSADQEPHPVDLYQVLSGAAEVHIIS